MNEYTLHRRALTDADKRAIIERLYTLWISHPQLRLGQLILNVFPPGEDFYHVEDQDFMTRLEKQYQQWDNAKSNI